MRPEPRISGKHVAAFLRVFDALVHRPHSRIREGVTSNVHTCSTEVGIDNACCDRLGARESVGERPHRIVKLDDSLALRAAEADTESFLRQAGEATLIFDEAQLNPGLTRTLKRNVDEDRFPGPLHSYRSANLLRAKADAGSLAGRAVTLHLRGISRGELWQVRDDFVAAILATDSPEGASSTWGHLHHYRDRDGLEVDIIVEQTSGIIGIEVKSASSFRPNHFANLLKLADRVGPREPAADTTSAWQNRNLDPGKTGTQTPAKPELSIP